MSKILAVADIHINDYPNRNPSNRYRLYQTRTVTQNIIEAGKTYGCDYIVLAGDVVEHYLIKPYIQYEVKLFLDRDFQDAVFYGRLAASADYDGLVARGRNVIRH